MNNCIKPNEIHSLANEYSRFFGGIRSFLIRYRPKICPFEDILRFVPRGARVFDIGCGSGFMLLGMSRLCGAIQLIGVDANSKVVEQALELLPQLMPDVELVLQTSSLLEEWPPDQFDVVTMIDVLHHIPVNQQAAFIKAAADRVTSGGIMIYKDMAAKPFWFGLANRIHDLLLAKQWIDYVPIETVVDHFSNSGLSKINRIDRTMWWYSHQLVVLRRPGKQFREKGTDVNGQVK